MKKDFDRLYNFLGLKKEQVEFITHNIDSFYYAKRKPKMKYGEYQRDKHGNIKYRDLIIPTGLLKQSQECLNKTFQFIPLPNNMYGSIQGRNNVLNALQHTGHKYFLTIDLKNFFTNISHHQVYKILLANNCPKAICGTITKLITYKKSVPQGASTSPAIANLVFKGTAEKLSELAKKNNVVFTTFLDDLSFSSNTCFKTLVPEILELIKQNGFYPHNSKIHYRVNTCEVTGLIVAGKKLYVRREMIQKAQTNTRLLAYCNYVTCCNAKFK